MDERTSPWSDVGRLARRARGSSIVAAILAGAALAVGLVILWPAR